MSSLLSEPEGYKTQLNGVDVIEGAEKLDIRSSGAVTERRGRILDVNVNGLTHVSDGGLYFHRQSRTFSPGQILGNESGFGAVQWTGETRVQPFYVRKGFGVDRITVTRSGTSGGGWDNGSLHAYRTASNTNLYPGDRLFKSTSFAWPSTDTDGFSAATKVIEDFGDGNVVAGYAKGRITFAGTPPNGDILQVVFLSGTTPFVSLTKVASDGSAGADEFATIGNLYIKLTTGSIGTKMGKWCTVALADGVITMTSKLTGSRYNGLYCTLVSGNAGTSSNGIGISGASGPFTYTAGAEENFTEGTSLCRFPDETLVWIGMSGGAGNIGTNGFQQTAFPLFGYDKNDVHTTQILIGSGGTPSTFPSGATLSNPTGFTRFLFRVVE